MIVHFEESFLKDVRKIRSATLKSRIEKVIDQMQKAESLKQSQKVKKLRGHHNAYRIRIGEYRIGLFMEGNAVIFSICLHRKDIYKCFLRCESFGDLSGDPPLLVDQEEPILIQMH